MSDKSSGKRDKMSAIVDWREEICCVAGPYTGNRKGWLSEAARKVGVSYRQLRALWYREITDPKFSVANRVLGAADRARSSTERNPNVVASEQLASHAARLAATDEDFYRDEIIRIRRAADLLRRLD